MLPPREGLLASLARRYRQWAAPRRERARLRREQEARDAARSLHTRSHKAVYARLQAEAAARPGSVRVETPLGEVWLSPIEHRLYEAMRALGLEPVPQYCASGFSVDLAFPERRPAVEADGAAFHSGDRRARDRRRDAILRSKGWRVRRFQGTTIHRKAGSCAWVVRQVLEGKAQ